MKLSLCNEELDKLLFSRPKKIVVYGEAGTGKTNLLLNIIKCSHVYLNNQETIVFISTEGLSFASRIAMFNISTPSIFFSVAIDQQHVIENIIDLIKKLDSIKLVCIIIDSINNHYRIESLMHKGVELFIKILSLLDGFNKNGVHIISSAQVRANDREEIVPGYSYLNYWSDVVIELKRSALKRVLVFHKPRIKRVFEFYILARGIKWIT